MLALSSMACSSTSYSKIDLGSVAGLLERENDLAAYFPACDRWADLDLAAMAATSCRSGCDVTYATRSAAHRFDILRPPPSALARALNSEELPKLCLHMIPCT